MKLKSLFLFFLLLFIFFLFTTKRVGAASAADMENLSQQIEIIKQEISLIQSLILNSQSRKEITAKSYLAISLSDNSVILEKNSNQPYPIASVTKLMNAIVVLENIDMEKTITLTEKMLEPYGQSPSLFPGLNISAENLLKASLTQSVNDAAEALAYFMGKDKFLDLMNQKAKELNMTNTIFYDVHGLNPANRSTAQDLAKLLLYIYKNHAEILDITRDDNFWLPDKTGRLLKLRNQNNFYPLSTFIGGKTGDLPEAKQTLASIFNVNGPVAIVLLYSNNRQADVFSILKKLN
jgi:D-alanyl-D-alanine carboxypeptidase